MFKRESKKLFVILTLVLSVFMFTLEAFASYHYVLEYVGDTVMEYSDTELKGKIHVNATFSMQYYDGELEYQLQKKSLFGYSNVGNRQRKSTYNKTQDYAEWDCSNSKTMYRGFIELTKKDTRGSYNSISGYLSVTSNN